MITRYLGDPNHLPPLYVSPSGATVYHVGPVDNEVLYESFLKKDLIPPIKQLTVNLTILSGIHPQHRRIHIPIPIDYRGGFMVISMESCGHIINLELRRGIASNNRETQIVKRWSSASNAPSLFAWRIDEAGYFTLFIFSDEQLEENLNVSMCIHFFSCWEVDSKFG